MCMEKMSFTCRDKSCGEFVVTSEKKEMHVQNKNCFFASKFIDRKQFQALLDEMCDQCISIGES